MIPKGTIVVILKPGYSKITTLGTIWELTENSDIDGNFVKLRLAPGTQYPSDQPFDRNTEWVLRKEAIAPANLTKLEEVIYGL